VEAVVADTGPKNHLGEISVACAQAIGVRSARPIPHRAMAHHRRPFTTSFSPELQRSSTV